MRRDLPPEIYVSRKFFSFISWKRQNFQLKLRKQEKGVNVFPFINVMHEFLMSYSFNSPLGWCLRDVKVPNLQRPKKLVFLFFD